MVNGEKELLKFVTNQKYREKVIAKIHKDQDSQYNNQVNAIKIQRDNLSKNKFAEIERIANARWQPIGGNLLVNRTEGKIRINGSEVLFSSIKGAELNMQTGFRTVSTEISHSRKHASLGGAIGGGLLFGPIGTVAGGVGLGKTNSSGHVYSNQIPTCLHLGVMVNVDGFVSEILLITRQVDQTSRAFANVQSAAQNIISQLSVLSNTPVPSAYLKPEEELVITEMDKKIAAKVIELQNAIADRPKYKIPALYRTSEQRDLSDSDYLEYLKKQDADRLKQCKEDKQKKYEEKSSVKKYSNIDYGNTIKKTLRIIGLVVLWALSIFYLLISFSELAEGGIVSCLIFFVSGLFINPLVFKLLNEKIIKIPFWICILVIIVAFFAGAETAPHDKRTNYVPGYNNIVLIEHEI